MKLGAGYRPPPEPITPELEPPTPAELSNLAVLDLLAGLRDQLAQLPAPQVHVEPQDLAAVVTAVNGLKPNVNADEIGRAVARALAPTSPDPGVSPETVERLTKVLEGLDFRMQAQPYSGGPSMDRVESLLAEIVATGGGSGGTVNQGAAGTDPWPVAVSDGVDVAEVNARTDGIKALEVNDDFTSFEANHQTLASSTDTTVTFAQPVRMVQVMNWHTAARVLVKDGAIASDVDASAARVGFAPAISVPGKNTFPFKTTTIHLRSSGSPEVTVIGYF